MRLGQVSLFAAGALLGCALSAPLALTQAVQPDPDEYDTPDLPAGIRATEGCIGVRLARTEHNRNLILAWFEDKAAVKRWYYSDMHQGTMNFLTDIDEVPEPLQHIADDSGPIMVIASIMPSEKPELEGVHMPISEIAIELYQPLPGGAYLGGRLAPKDLKVEHMRNYTPPPAEPTNASEADGDH